MEDVDLVLGLMGLAEGRAPTVIVNYAVTVENTD